MFHESNVGYIFASLGIEPKEIKKRSFFKKLFKKSAKNSHLPYLNSVNDFYKCSETFITSISKYSDNKCLSFHLYLEDTHEDFIKSIKEEKKDKYYIFPFFPQTASQLSLIAKFFSDNLESEKTDNFFWVKPYHLNGYFIRSIQKNINDIFKKNKLDQKETMFLYIANNDYISPLYLIECQTTCQKIIKAYQFVDGMLYYYPSNLQVLNDLEKNLRKNIIIIPISTIITDIELSKNLENLKNFLESQKKRVFYSKPLNESEFFIRSIVDIIEEKNFISNNMLLTQI